MMLWTVLPQAHSCQSHKNSIDDGRVVELYGDRARRYLQCIAADSRLGRHATFWYPPQFLLWTSTQIPAPPRTTATCNLQLTLLEQTKPLPCTCYGGGVFNEPGRAHVPIAIVVLFCYWQCQKGQPVETTKSSTLMSIHGVCGSRRQVCVMTAAMCDPSSRAGHGRRPCQGFPISSMNQWML